ncbi:hypothetical protein [Glycomyces halotolerans]
MLAAVMVLGIAVIVVVSLLAMSFIADAVNPSPPESESERGERRVSAEVDWHRLNESVDSAMARTGRDHVDSSGASSKAFVITYAVFLFAAAWGSVRSHAVDPGEGFPLSQALFPMWAPVVVALIAGLAAGRAYRRRYWLWPESKRREVERRRLEKRDRDLQDRLRAIRRSHRSA